MSRSYFTEDSKMFKAPIARWSLEECSYIQETLSEKGYFVNCVSRIGSDRKYHDALEVEREDMPQFIEQCFRQRLVVEVQAEGHGKASVNFVYDNPARQIITAVRRFQKNNGGSL